MNQISDRLRGLVQSDIRRMSRECERVGGINLGQGICDLPTIPELVDGACDAIRVEQGDVLEVRRDRHPSRADRAQGRALQRIHAPIRRTRSWSRSDRAAASLAAAMATLNAGDEVILFEPYYGYHLNTFKVLGFEPKFVPLQAPDWSIDFDVLRAAFTPKTRGIVVCTPSNPCGKVFTREELEKIGALCREFGAWVFTDEIYEYIVYDGRKHVSDGVDRVAAATWPSRSADSRRRSRSPAGASATSSPTSAIAGPIGLMNDLFAICAPTPLQWGVARALEIGDEYYAQHGRRTIRRNATCSPTRSPRPASRRRFRKARTTCSRRFRKSSATTSEAAQALLETPRVASVPGSAFFVSEAARGCCASASRRT